METKLNPQNYYNKQFPFKNSFRVSAEVADLEQLGWDFDYQETADAMGITLEEARSYVYETYHIDITVNEDGKTFWNYTNTHKQEDGYWEGSDKEPTGDDQATMNDIRHLYSQNRLWNVENL